ncbi:MAG: hypothetical protein FWF77_05675 [Defluviitaleaceae bacterium]|nr:hypothetical protein [Defluviitaleaceae bacterium]
MKKTRKPIALIAAVIAIMALSVGALAAAGPVWRQIELRFYGDGNIGNLEAWILEDDDADMAIMLIRGEVDASMYSDRGDDNSATFRIDGTGNDAIVSIAERNVFDNLDDALSHFAFENVLLPTYLPEGFSFIEASFPTCPTANPDDEFATRNVLLVYGDGERLFSVQITYYPTDMEMSPVSIDETEVFDETTTVYIRAHSRHIGDVAYIFISSGEAEQTVDYATLVRVADSLG